MFCGDTKNGSDKILPLTDAVKNELKRFRAVGSGLVFGNPKRPKRPYDFRNEWTAALEEAKIDVIDEKGEKLVFHSMRHTFCSTLSNTGAELHEIAALAGHKSIQTTMRYTHTNGNRLACVINKTFSELGNAVNGSDNPCAIEVIGSHPHPHQILRFLPLTPTVCICVVFDPTTMEPNNFDFRQKNFTLPAPFKWVLKVKTDIKLVLKVNRAILKNAEELVFSSKLCDKLDKYVRNFSKYRVESEIEVLGNVTENSHYILSRLVVREPVSS